VEEEGAEGEDRGAWGTWITIDVEGEEGGTWMATGVEGAGLVVDCSALCDGNTWKKVRTSPSDVKMTGITVANTICPLKIQKIAPMVIARGTRTTNTLRLQWDQVRLLCISSRFKVGRSCRDGSIYHFP